MNKKLNKNSVLMLVCIFIKISWNDVEVIFVLVLAAL